MEKTTGAPISKSAQSAPTFAKQTSPKSLKPEDKMDETGDHETLESDMPKGILGLDDLTDDRLIKQNS